MPLVLVILIGMSLIGVLAAYGAAVTRDLYRQRPDLTASLLAATEDSRTEWLDGVLVPRARVQAPPTPSHGFLGETRNTGSVPTLPPDLRRG